MAKDDIARLLPVQYDILLRAIFINIHAITLYYNIAILFSYAIGPGLIYVE